MLHDDTKKYKRNADKSIMCEYVYYLAVVLTSPKIYQESTRPNKSISKDFERPITPSIDPSM
jgi:hypothetical protein